MAFTMSPDAELVRRVLTGDPVAQDELAETCRGLALGLARGRFGLSRDSAEEVAQQTLLRLWQDDLKALRAWRGDGKITTYVTVIVTRLCLATRRREASESHAAPPTLHAVADDPAPDARIEENQRSEALLRAIHGLRPRDRLLLRLRFTDERSPREIAALLGLEPGTARKALHDALGRLRKRLRRAERGANEESGGNGAGNGASHP